MTSTSRRASSSAALERLFHAYYSSKPRLELPGDMELREFAYQPFGSKGYVRHLAFQDRSQLLEELRRRTPLHLYYSSARYQYPEAPNMEDKGWLGSDLIFDIDADHLPGCSPLKLRFCPRCGFIADEAVRGEKCPACGSQLAELVMVPGECIALAAREAYKLASRLRDELGLKPRTYFSGHRGFHVHVECTDRCGALDSGHRRELVDYLKGIGVSADHVFAGGGRGVVEAAPRPGDPGWRGLVGRTLHRMAPGVESMREALEETGMGPQELLEAAVEEWGVSIDEKVTIDVKRLVRIPGSLHGKTGLVVREVAEQELRSFEPSLEDYSVFRGEVVVRPLISIAMEVPGGGEISLSRGETLRIDAARGIYLAAKGVAVIVDAEGVEVL